MSMGVEEIDARQRQILRRVRHLVSSVSTGQPDEIRAAMRYLHGALAEHQALEEGWMVDAGYPAAREHGRVHAAILELLAGARADTKPGAGQRLAAAAEECVRAVEEHMRRDDLKLARFWVARENLRRLAENGPGVGLCLTPIPGTLAAVAPPPKPAPTSAPAPAPANAEAATPVPLRRK